MDQVVIADFGYIYLMEIGYDWLRITFLNLKKINYNELAADLYCFFQILVNLIEKVNVDLLQVVGGTKLVKLVVYLSIKENKV